MNSQKRWGPVLFAGLFALIAIGGASILNYFPHAPKKTGNAPQETLKGFSYGGGTTASLSEELVTDYANLVNSGTYTPEEEQKLIADIVTKHVDNPKVVPLMTLEDLNVSATASLDTYEKLFALIMGESGKVKEYELNVFSRAVINDNPGGAVVLAEGAELYARIAAALLVMEVPPALASKHLEAVKSVGALANAVATMAAWDGDPIEALVMVDTFNKSEAYVKTSVEDLAVEIEAQKKS